MVSLVVPAVVLKEVDADVLIVEEVTGVSTVVTTVGVNVVSNVVTEVSNVVTTGVVETRVSDGVVAVAIVRGVLDEHQVIRLTTHFLSPYCALHRFPYFSYL